MGTHPIFESDFDCLTDLKMRITGVLRKKIFWEQGKWHHIPGAQDSGKHFLPPKITENQRREVIEKLWREARNEMWLVRHKYEETPEGAPDRASRRMDQKYPDLRKHLACRIDTDNLIFRYPKPVERP